MAAEFDVQGVEEFTDGLKAVQSNYPKEVKSFMQKEGNKLKRRTLSKAKSSVNKITGNYFEGIKRGKYYKYRGIEDTVRIYAGRPAYHAHLIEYGHQKVLWGKRTNEKTKAYEPFILSADEFESTYDSDCEKFADELMKKLD